MRTPKISPILIACVLVGCIAGCPKPGSPDVKSSNAGSSQVTSGETKPALDPEARTKQLNELADRLAVDYKNDPLRVAYETEVKDLKPKADALLQQRGTSPAALEQTAREMSQARRDLGAKYKDKTPEPLRDYIYDANQTRYGDPLGPTFEFLMNKYQGDHMKIIEGSTRPNPDINAFMSGFRTWLLEGTHGDKYLAKDGQPSSETTPPH